MITIEAKLAQEIVERTMKIIPFNVNVMDTRGIIIGSGNPARIGELHSGAQLALAQQRNVEIDEATAHQLHIFKPGINLPLHVRGQICGAVGLTGDPDIVRQFAELVRITAEMILEQSQLIAELQREKGYREEFLLQIVKQGSTPHEELEAWASRLGVDFQRPRAVAILDITEEGARPDDSLAALQRCQSQFVAKRPDALSAAISPRELIVLEAIDEPGVDIPRSSVARHHLSQLDTLLRKDLALASTLSLGVALTGIEGIPLSYQSARRTARVGRQRDPQASAFSFYDLSLPVLLAGLGAGWQSVHLRQPLERLQLADRRNGLLRRTLNAWFANNEHPSATARALSIHRNTLDYRLRQIGEATGLDLENTDDKLLLYIALQLE